MNEEEKKEISIRQEVNPYGYPCEISCNESQNPFPGPNFWELTAFPTILRR